MSEFGVRLMSSRLQSGETVWALKPPKAMVGLIATPGNVMV